MSKIVFFCIPAYGHTNPTLGVVREGGSERSFKGLGGSADSR